MIDIKRILAPTDFSPHAEHALRYACALAERFGADLHVLHVVPEIAPVSPDPFLVPAMPHEFYQEEEHRVAKSLETAVDPSWGKPRSLTTAIRWGTAAPEVVDYAAEQDADLIVVATHGRTGLSHVLLGSVAERIVREAPCPVLTIRDPGLSKPTGA
jgi:nucleotide-binding universal stress UspA family protein